MKILDRIKRGAARLSRSPGPVVGGGAVARNVDLSQIETVQQEEFEDKPESREESE